MARRIFAWECEFCGDVRKNETIMLRHEKTCLSNPEAKNCVLCANSYEAEGKLKCKERLCWCSRAISAKCKYFIRRS